MNINPSGTYTLSYYKEGKIHKIRRTPPPKLHTLEVGDDSKITRKKNDDWDRGDKVTIKSINPRHPNTLQIEKNGVTSFLDFMDLDFEGKSEKNFEDVKKSNLKRKESAAYQYLLWP